MCQDQRCFTCGEELNKNGIRNKKVIIKNCSLKQYISKLPSQKEIFKIAFPKNAFENCHCKDMFY